MYFTVFSGTYLGYRNKLPTDRCHFFQPVCYQTTNKQIIGSHLVQWNKKKKEYLRAYFAQFTRQYQRQQVVFLLLHVHNLLYINRMNFERIESKFLLLRKNSLLPPIKRKYLIKIERI